MNTESRGSAAATDASSHAGPRPHRTHRLRPRRTHRIRPPEDTPVPGRPKIGAGGKYAAEHERQP